LKQAIEVDAIAFAYYQMKELFNVEVKIPDKIKNEMKIKLMEWK
jgi:hypothetical protein